MIGFPWRAVQCGASSDVRGELLRVRSRKVAHFCLGFASSFSGPWRPWLRSGGFGLILFLLGSVGLDDLDLALVVHAQAAHHHHILARQHAGQHLDLVALAHAQLHGALVGHRVRIDHQHGGAAGLAGKNRGHRHQHGVLDGLGDNRDVHRRAGLQRAVGVVRLHPHLHRGAVGIGGGAHHRHLARYLLAGIRQR